MDPRLYEAATSGNVDILHQEIAKDNLDIFLQVTPRKSTVLHLAAEFGHTEFVRVMVATCPSLLLQPNLMGDTPLHIAARVGHANIVEFLINGTKELKKDVESGGVEAVDELLKMANMKKDTVLHVAVRNRHLEVIKLLIKADPGLSQFINSADESPLFLAAEAGLFEFVDEIARISSSSPGGPNGLNALHTAIFQGHQDVTKILLDKKPELIKEADTHGWTPLHYAAYYGYSGTVEQLLEFDRSVTYVTDGNGTTSDSALHIAAAEGHVDVIKELIRRCPDSIQLLNDKGQNALHVAVQKGQADVVRYFLSGPKLDGLINETDNDGNTALHLASCEGKLKIVEILLKDSRVNKGAVNNDNFTALDVVESRRDLIQSLRLLFIRRKLEAGGVVRGPRRPRKLKDGPRKLKDGEGDKTDNSDMSKISETHLLVATLIATVTFAAGFTLPGGYEGEGPNKGMATLGTKAAFQVFLISDTIAFSLSAASIFLHFVASIIRETIPRRHSTIAAAQLTLCAILWMEIAFISGVYVVVAHSPGLAIAACAIASSIFLFHCIIGGTMVVNSSLASSFSWTNFIDYVILAMNWKLIKECIFLQDHLPADKHYKFFKWP